MKWALAIGMAVAWTMPLALPASAQNQPCSGRKGGISHCQGRTFVCNDGSVSGSKRHCSAERGGDARGLMGGGSSSNMRPAARSGQCSCRSGSYCTGPRGGRFCITDRGNKSYLRQ